MGNCWSRPSAPIYYSDESIAEPFTTDKHRLTSQPSLLREKTLVSEKLQSYCETGSDESLKDQIVARKTLVTEPSIKQSKTPELPLLNTRQDSIPKRFKESIATPAETIHTNYFKHNNVTPTSIDDAVKITSAPSTHDDVVSVSTPQPVSTACTTVRSNTNVNNNDVPNIEPLTSRITDQGKLIYVNGDQACPLPLISIVNNQYGNDARVNSNAVGLTNEAKHNGPAEDVEYDDNLTRSNSFYKNNNLQSHHVSKRSTARAPKSQICCNPQACYPEDQYSGFKSVNDHTKAMNEQLANNKRMESKRSMARSQQYIEDIPDIGYMENTYSYCSSMNSEQNVIVDDPKQPYATLKDKSRQSTITSDSFSDTSDYMKNLHFEQPKGLRHSLQAQDYDLNIPEQSLRSDSLKRPNTLYTPKIDYNEQEFLPSVNVPLSVVSPNLRNSSDYDVRNVGKYICMRINKLNVGLKARLQDNSIVIKNKLFSCLMKYLPQKPLSNEKFVTIRENFKARGDYINGYAEIHYPNGNTYIGFMNNRKAEPCGVLITESFSYAGQFLGGNFNGTGICLFNEGMYCGTFKNDKPDGKGIELLTMNVIYIGGYKKGKRQGYGILFLPSGDRYQGMFADDKFNGKGVYKWCDGRSYYGDWKHNEMHGFGRYELADGRSHIGQFSNNKFVQAG